jgi:hypothetical protein
MKPFLKAMGVGSLSALSFGDRIANATSKMGLPVHIHAKTDFDAPLAPQGT